MRRIASIRTLLLAAVLMLAAACDKTTEVPRGDDPGDTPEQKPITTIAGLKQLGSQLTYPIVRDINLRARVVANDRYGEFTKTLVVQDASGGISILIDHTQLFTQYPFGATVEIHCNGLALGRGGGRIQLGAPPTGEYAVDRIPKAEIGRYIRLLPPEEHAPEPLHLRFGEVEAQHIGRYIYFDNVRFTTPGMWFNAEPGTLQPDACEREISDTQGNRFIVRVAGSSLYAAEPVPSGTGSVCGILDWFDGNYSLRVTNREFYFTAAATHPTAYLSTGGYSVPTPTR